MLTLCPHRSRAMAVSSSPVVCKWICQNLLLMCNIVAVLTGIIGGGVLRYATLSSGTIHLIGYPGSIFMNILKMLIIPLIVASLVSGLAQLDARESGKVGSRAIAYYALTTTHAVILGIIVVMLIHPGDPSIKKDSDHLAIDKGSISALDKFLDLIRNMFPDNIVRATFQQSETERILNNITGKTVFHVKYTDGMNVLGLIMFCIVMGIVISATGKPAKPLGDFFIALDIVITRMVGIYMWFGPIGIASLVMEKMLEVDDLAKTAQVLGMFIVTVVTGLSIQAFITLPLIYYLSSRLNPYTFMKGLLPAIMTAFGTSSSAASLPVTFQCLNQLGIDTRITKFVLPVGAMINMDGTALYEAVGSIFIAQLNGMDMNIGQIITVSVTATLASIGAASIPSAGLVTMIIVLTALGLPSNDISLILTIDFLLDRLRTAVNVIGDAYGCGFVYALCKDDIEEIEKRMERNENEMERNGLNHWGHKSHNTLAIDVKLDQ
ncbi:hypothetical protein PFISCL1PPCAC_8584, partial [Pristionchus fissidentatus]